MNIVQFLENRYQELQYQSQGEIAYNCRLDAEMKALQQMLSGYRTALKWLSMPKHLFHFWEVSKGLKPCPEPVLLNKMRQEQKEKELKAEVDAGIHLKPVENINEGTKPASGT